MPRGLKVTTRSPEETRTLGAALGPTLLPGDVISLSGDLGAGKTVFVQGLGASLGVRERITSPTFTLLHEYPGRYLILHLDVYRLSTFQEVIDLGFEELLDPAAILLVEWGHAVEPLLPAKHLQIELRRSEGAGESERDVTFLPHGPNWIPKLQEMRVTAEALLNAISGEGSWSEGFVEVEVPNPRDHWGEMRQGWG
jgi:tRNA threonylcarbamoyladenosine biosynthesis protein TsaE